MAQTENQMKLPAAEFMEELKSFYILVCFSDSTVQKSSA